MNMPPKLQQAPTPEPGRNPSPAVHGLDAGRDHARVQLRRKRRRDRIRNLFLAVLGIAVLGGVAYAGYIMYGDFSDDEEQERQEIRAELDAESGRIVSSYYGRRYELHFQGGVRPFTAAAGSEEQG